MTSKLKKISKVLMLTEDVLVIQIGNHLKTKIPKTFNLSKKSCFQVSKK